MVISNNEICHDAKMSHQKIYDDELFTHFVTFSCYRNRHLLNDDQTCRIVLGVLQSQIEIQRAIVLGLVIMPNHVHAMVWFPEPNQLSKFMKQWKQRTSRTIRKEVLPKLSKYKQSINDDDPFWQRKYHAFHIWSAAKVQEKLEYMHMNPVRAGLVERATDWKWSSARYYECGKSVGVEIGWLPD